MAAILADFFLVLLVITGVCILLLKASKCVCEMKRWQAVRHALLRLSFPCYKQSKNGVDDYVLCYLAPLLDIYFLIWFGNSSLSWKVEVSCILGSHDAVGCSTCSFPTASAPYKQIPSFNSELPSFSLRSYR